MTETGETTASMNARADAEQWTRIKPLMDNHKATLVWHPGMMRFYTKNGDEYGQYGIGKTFVKNLVKEGIVVRVGVDEYGVQK